MTDKTGRCFNAQKVIRFFQNPPRYHHALLDHCRRIAKRFIRSQKRYETLFNAIPQPVWIVDRNTLRFLAVNEAAIQHYGYSETEFLKMNLREMRPCAELDKFHRAFQKAKPNLLREAETFTHVCKDGSKIDVKVVAHDIEYRGRAARIVLVVDVTEQLKAERDILLKKKNAENASEIKSQFLANMSHEIRTPLGAILGFAELLTDQNHDPEERQLYIDTILRNGKQLALIINDILDLSKIESGKFTIERIPIRPMDILEDVFKLMGLQARAKGLELSVSHADNTPDFIHTDPTRLRQVLINLIGNAIKFTAAGKVQVHVQPGSNGLRNSLEFIVSDTGPGITDEEQSRLFKPFSQGDTSVTRKFGGTGLGLLVSKKLAAALGGDLTVLETCIGSGSKFLFEVDLEGSASAKIEKDEVDEQNTDLRDLLDQKRAPRSEFMGTQILVVDDAADNCLLVRRLLGPAGFHVVSCDNGAAGVQAAKRERFALVLMDIQMPIMDGFEALKAMRSNGLFMPIVAMTAHAMKEDRERFLEAGFDSYVMKPTSRSELLKTIYHLLEGSHQTPRYELIQPQPFDLFLDL